MARAPAPVPGARPLVRAALLPAALALVAALALPAPAEAQEAPPSTPEAYRDDVASVDAIIHALYDVISGPVGEARDWDRFRALFIPGARLIPTGGGPGGVVYRVQSADEWAASSGPNLVNIGFREHEIARRTEAFGNIVHVFSTYEGFRRGETEPYLRGINSIQLLFDGERWWIVTVFWSPETEEHPLPEGYLPGG